MWKCKDFAGKLTFKNTNVKKICLALKGRFSKKKIAEINLWMTSFSAQGYPERKEVIIKQEFVVILNNKQNYFKSSVAYILNCKNESIWNVLRQL